MPRSSQRHLRLPRALRGSVSEMSQL